MKSLDKLFILGIANLTPYEWVTPMFVLVYIVLYFYNKKVIIYRS